MAALTPFTYLNSINMSKQDLMELPDDEKLYVPFVINRSLSYFNDTVLLANELNINHHLDHRMQYDFLLHTVRKGKRFSKWGKATNPADIDVVKEYFDYSNEKAVIALSLLSDDQISELRDKVNRGGKKKSG
jgi:Holliday junction resolvase RusA-like endonuclease